VLIGNPWLFLLSLGVVEDLSVACSAHMSEHTTKSCVFIDGH